MNLLLVATAAAPVEGWLGFTPGFSGVDSKKTKRSNYSLPLF
jgi:hypothetical protein